MDRRVYTPNSVEMCTETDFKCDLCFRNSKARKYYTDPILDIFCCALTESTAIKWITEQYEKGRD